jgi:putative sugar O-methyltransferase
MNINKINQLLDLIKNYDSDHKSKHWSGEYDNRSVPYSAESLKDFRNNSQVDGLNRSVDDLDKDYIRKHFKSLINKCGYDFVFQNLDQLNCGNNHNYEVHKDRFVSVGDNFHINFLYELNKYVFKGNQHPKIVCEIGGGYGNLSKLIYMNDFCSKIILIDLPEANLMSYYYLSSNFPKANFYTYSGENDLITSKIISDHDFIIIPPWVGFDSDIKIDLFINTRSMMEMNFEIIKGYFLFIHKHIRSNGFFYNVNKLHKNTVGQNIDLDKYPYDNKWTVLSSKPSWMQESKIYAILTQRESKGSTSVKRNMRILYVKKIIYLIRRKIDASPMMSKIYRTLRPILRGVKFLKQG